MNDRGSCSGDETYLDDENNLDFLDSPLMTPTVDLATQATIEGEEAQIVTIDLKPGQVIRTRPNTMLYREEDIQMKTHMPQGALRRFLSHTPLFLVDYIKNTNRRKTATLALSFRRPGKILRINMDDHDGKLTIRKGAFMVGSPDLKMGIQKSSKSVLAQFFGGQGLLLQTLCGTGSVLLRSGGVQIKKHLQKDEVLRIHPASLVAFSGGVNYNVTKSTSFNNVVFGDESLFVSTVSGPGTVWLQGMDPSFFVRKESTL